MPVVSCQQCGKEFTTKKSEIKRGKGKYCSKNCYSEFQKGKPPSCMNSKLKSGIYRSCEQCGTEIYVKPSKIKKGEGKYCSLKCCIENRRLNKLRTIKIKGESKIINYHSYVKCTCLHCKKKFDVTRYNFNRGEGKYCSRRCHLNTLPPKVEHRCHLCEKVFYRAPSLSKYQPSKFCSKKCLNKYKGPTSIEILIEEEIKKLGLRFESQKKIGRWSIDFFIPLKNLAVETDGTYWHTKDRKVIERDLRKNKWLRENGYNIIRIPEHEIKIDPEEALMSRLAPFLQQGEMMNGYHKG